MFIGDMTPTNIWDYVRRFHANDERTGPRVCGHVSPYVCQLTDEAMGPRSWAAAAM
jgi:hypothetical protein